MNIDVPSVLATHRMWVAGREGGRRADLRHANLDGADLRRANLDGANLRRANLRRANLDGANLDGADLSHANLSHANLRRANLRRANLDGANLYGANLYGANLDGANLYGANLWGATGNMREVRSLQCDAYAVTYTSDVIQIGCQRHRIGDWWEFDDDAIHDMDGGLAVAWWGRWKPILKSILEASPATPTGHEEGDQ